MKKVINEYMDVYKNSFQAFYTSLKEVNWKDFTILIHALKGACLNVGAKDCGEKAKALEIAGRNKDISYIQSNLNSFTKEYHDLIQSFENVIEKFYQTDEISSVSDLSDSVIEILRDFKESISNFDFAKASALLKEARNATDAKNHSDLLNRLEVLMEEVNIEEILSISLET